MKNQKDRNTTTAAADETPSKSVQISYLPPQDPVQSSTLDVEFSESIEVHTVAITRRTRIILRRLQPLAFSFQLSALLLTLTAGCTIPRPLRGGKAVTSPSLVGGLDQTILQGENPSVPSRQTQETIRVRTYTFPQPATFNLQPSTVSTTPSLHHSTTPFPVLAPSLITDREETRATTQLGAAQKDTGRELAAKLSSLKSTVWVGLALFLFGLASFAWPPLKLIIGSVTTSAAITAGGIVLIILPTLLVGHELLILAGVSLAVALWFLAHRHGHLRGLLTGSSSSPFSSSSSIRPQPASKRSEAGSAPLPAAH